MDLYQIVLPKDNDWEVMSELGQICIRQRQSNNGSHSSSESSEEATLAATQGVIQLIDLNAGLENQGPAKQQALRYFHQLRRAEEAERDIE